MTRYRPTAILVIAILHILGGGIGLFGSCYSIVIMGAAGMSSTSAPAPPLSAPPLPPSNATSSRTPPAIPNTSQIMKYYEDHVPGYKLFTFAGLGVSFVLAVMLLASGIGLLKMQPWARRLSLAYAPLSILFHIISFVYQLILLMPVTHDLFAQISGPIPMGAILEVATNIGFVVGFLVIAYPIVVLVVMLRRSTVTAFRDEVPEAEAVDRFADDPWHEPLPRSDKFQR
jgi:hypothetical protein